ncbi:tRNA (guanosine(37)-N1)-methyltransferase TrmD [Williamsoniiplasma luminosum]|uniref:tRNA (guanine-N(1)-)-methyltransferase n=1 Tax=Williamsoniiplasma luminosum TaxID=214888 RepID=A0A2S0NJQ6_9MOLU|nr:tRNA (guanosine(37)-N1)-methyltransferase TrmD [Williamsoniiplasma luminosum]AVP49239.1 MAG: tRNA (guanosine(37)-N1)-methyltransferase TrmD [Williamsoniiplasma luminosum]
MKFSIITLFPKTIQAYIEESIIKKALERNLLEVEIIDLRDYTTLKQNQVDEYQFGGGKGMVLMVEPIVNAIEAIKTKNSWIILTTPQGKTWNQNLAKQSVQDHDHIIIICGHYEGYDERVLEYVDQEISIGDYVLTGGEIPALVILDSMTRSIPDVIKKESFANDSFENDLLDYPVYTKPVDFRGSKVPDVLLSGHHANIQKFRDEQQVINTWNKRPDLINESKLNKNQKAILNKLKKGESYEYKTNKSN